MPRPPKRPDGSRPSRPKGAPPKGPRPPRGEGGKPFRAKGAPRRDAREEGGHRGGGPREPRHGEATFDERRGEGAFEDHRGGAASENHRGGAAFENKRGGAAFDDRRGGAAMRPRRGAGAEDARGGGAHEPRAAGAQRPRGRARYGQDAGEPRQEDRPRAPRTAQAGAAHHADDAPAPPRPGAGAGSGAYWIYGQHAVLGALSNPLRKPRRLLATPEAEATLRERFSGPWRVTPERSERSRFGTFLPEDAIHQGIALLAEPLDAVALEDAIEAGEGPVLLLDQVTDPRNVGAALRAAAAFGAACVVLQDRHAPPETGALARAASGTLDIVPVVREVNLSRAIATLQKAGFWVLGLAGEAKRTLAEAVPRDRRVALVLGAEDAGLRRLQRETCDELVRLPMAEGVESLNVSAAAAVALYEVVRR